MIYTRPVFIRLLVRLSFQRRRTSTYRTAQYSAQAVLYYTLYSTVQQLGVYSANIHPGDEGFGRNKRNIGRRCEALDDYRGHSSQLACVAQLAVRLGQNGMKMDQGRGW